MTSLRWCSRASDIGTTTIPPPLATTSTASRSVMSGSGSRLLPRELGGHVTPLGDVVGVLQQVLVGEVVDRHLLERRDDVVRGDDDHRDLVVERDQAQPLAVHR